MAETVTLGLIPAPDIPEKIAGDWFLNYLISSAAASTGASHGRCWSWLIP